MSREQDIDELRGAWLSAIHAAARAFGSEEIEARLRLAAEIREGLVVIFGTVPIMREFERILGEFSSGEVVRDDVGEWEHGGARRLWHAFLAGDDEACGDRCVFRRDAVAELHPTTQALLEHIRDTYRQRIADANANESNLTKLAHADHARRMYGELVDQWCAAGFPDVPPEKHGRFVVAANEYHTSVERWNHGVRVDTSVVHATHLNHCVVLEHWRGGTFVRNLRVLTLSQSESSADVTRYYDRGVDGVSLTCAEWLVHPTTLEML